MYGIIEYMEDRCTAIDLFEKDYQLKVLTIKVQCLKCGHAWGIRIDDYNRSMDIPEKKFVCSKCHSV